MLIRAYRMRGHLAADLDPLQIGEREPQPELEPESYGFGEADLDREIFINGYLGLETATIREILEILKRTYCSTFGIEFMLPSFREQGLATEAVQALAGWAFTQADAKEIRARTPLSGTASRRVLEKSGFEFSGEETDPEAGAVAVYTLTRKAG